MNEFGMKIKSLSEQSKYLIPHTEKQHMVHFCFAGVNRAKDIIQI